MSSLVKRLMELNDDTFAPRDALAVLAFSVDSGFGDATVLADLGLATYTHYDPKLHGDLDCAPGATIAVFSDSFKVALNIGRERLRARYATRKH